MLQERFLDLISKYSNNAIFKTECWKEIATHYNARTRHYHNLHHLENMFQELEVVKQEVKEMDSLLFSIYCHDII